MAFSPVALWKKDTALNTYIFGLLLVGIPLTVFGTYVIYQLQVVGYIIGTDADGLPCLDYCLVPFGSQQLDLNSVLLYLNALGFGLGGVCAIFMTAYADFWASKSLLVAILIICYGVVSVPVYWLRDVSQSSFNALMALYVLFAVISYILAVLFNIFIPHCMRTAVPEEPADAPTLGRTSSTDTKTQAPKFDTIVDEEKTPAASKTRKYGFRMSVLGGVGNTAGGILGIVLVIILSQALPIEEGQTAGLLITTVVGFVTIAGSIVTYFGLPAIPAKDHKDWKAWWLELLTPLRDLFRRKNMLVLLLSYTIYVDTVFALNSVTSQLYFAQVQPDTLEYSLYTLASNLFSVVTQLMFYAIQVWRPPFSLEHWLVIGYAMILIIPVWGCIGLSETVSFGFKYRWEFYVQSFIYYLSNSIVNSTFRVLFAELVPKGSEIEWFGLQVVLSCATAWVSYVANAPLQNATHQLRFPLVLCLIILIFPVALEIMRCTMGLFARDRRR
ncbi:hypothetical protein GQ53DRAFT_739491 [Thozetella sp. PMI_491]|nr:hypothetical protein GQ53DRAFT_739491 [Thozetella sp. PMI_491]